MAFYAVYTSSSDCPGQFAAAPMENLGFNSAINRDCPTCNKTHGFTLDRTIQISSPSELKNFEAFCKTNNLLTDIKVQ